MYEYTIYNAKIQKEDIIFGHTLEDAFRRYPQFNPDEWECVYREYID